VIIWHQYRWFSLFSGCVMLVGCTVGPDFQTPSSEMPMHWKDTSVQSGSVIESNNPDPQWWHTFNDPLLTSLVERAVIGNLNVQQTLLRIQKAREQEYIQQAAGLPTLNATAGYTHEKLGAFSLAAGGPSTGPPAAEGLASLTRPIDIYNAGFDASWELDLFGKVRRSVEQAQAQTQEQSENRKDALVSLEAEVARTYIQLRANQALLSVTQEVIKIETAMVDIIHVRLQHGLSSQLDADQALNRLTQTQAQISPLQQQIEQTINTLSVLLGQQPWTLDTELGVEHPLPILSSSIAVSVPSTLLRRRPDIRNAETKLHAATANIGVAVAQLYPDISLTGEVGRSAIQLKALTNWASLFYQLGPSISLPIFQGGRLQANIRLAKAEQEEAALGYRETVLEAMRDVENGLVALRTDKDKQNQLQQAEQIAANQFTITQNRLHNGLADVLDVSDSEMSLRNAQKDVIQANIQVMTDIIALYKALGGGWESH
jgi:outer membrane protein, multidrug efflux system